MPPGDNTRHSLSAAPAVSRFIVYYRKVGGFSGFPMRVLYLIFIVCVGALLGAAIAAARHIRRHEGRASPVEKQAAQSPDGLPEDKEILVPEDTVHRD